MKTIPSVVKTLILYLFICVNTSAFGSVSDKTGTLIVTYQTDKQGERLDRIRFWVHGENYKQWLYPKKNMFVEDQPNKTRRVVIENLPEGQYSVEFLVPNTDYFFAEVPIRNVTITSGAVVKINQHISVKKDSSLPPEKELLPVTLPEIIAKKPGSLIISYSTLNNSFLLDNINFYLNDENGNNLMSSHQDNIINAVDNEGKVAILTDLPPGTYKLVFFEGEQKNQPIFSEEVGIQENTTTSVHYSF